MDLREVLQTIRLRIDEFAISPLTRFARDLGPEEMGVLAVLLGVAAAVGVMLGWRGAVQANRRRYPPIQNDGEMLVSDVLRPFGSPDYHLMNHITLPMNDGTTEVDHILVSRFGVFVIETKHYTGWIFGSESARRWTQVRYQARFPFQNPILQNKRHVRAVTELLDFVPVWAISSLVVFTGDAEFKTPMPPGVITIERLAHYVTCHTRAVQSVHDVQLCVGRLETARLAVSAETDVEHVQSLARRHGRRRARGRA